MTLLRHILRTLTFLTSNIAMISMAVIVGCSISENSKVPDSIALLVSHSAVQLILHFTEPKRAPAKRFIIAMLLVLSSIYTRILYVDITEQQDHYSSYHRCIAQCAET